LAWTDNSTTETGFKILRKTGAGAFAVDGQVAAGVTSFIDTGLTANTAYTYEVVATNSGGDSTPSNTVAVTTSGAGSVSGVVSIPQASGAALPLSGATVELLDASGANVLGTATTDNTGAYTFSPVNTGSYQVEVVAEPGQTQVPAQAVSVAAAAPAVTQNFSVTAPFVFPAGVTMVSVPYSFSATSQDAAALFGTNLIAAYLPTTNQYGVYPTLGGATPTVTQPGQGYWVKETSAQSFHTIGKAVPSPFQIVLQPGWNLIGDPFTTSVTTASLQVTLPIAVGASAANVPISFQTAVNDQIVVLPVWTWDPAQGQYVQATSVDPFKGYWLYVNSTITQGQAVTLTFTKSGA
jgi:hypothetical protein